MRTKMNMVCAMPVTIAVLSVVLIQNSICVVNWGSRRTGDQCFGHLLSETIQPFCRVTYVNVN